MNNEVQTESRRSFLIKLSLWLSVVPAVMVGGPVLGAFLGPLLRPTGQDWRGIGKLSDFPVGETKLISFENADPLPWAGTTAKSAAWVRRENEKDFIAFSANCTHLGCPVRWVEDAKLFMCPCHGGVYYQNGDVASGPPPKPLVPYGVRIHGDEVQLRTAPLPITNMTA